MDELRDISLSEMINSIPESIRSSFSRVTFKKGDTIIEQGDSVRYGYIVEEGSYDVIKTDFYEKTYLLERKYCGRFISLMDIYSGKMIQCATIRALSDMKVLRIPASQCIRMLYVPSLFQPYLIRMWAEQFYNTNVEQRNLPILSNKVKLCRYISKNATLKNGKYVLNMTRDTLVKVMGCSRRTLFRLLEKLKEEEIIETDRNEISLSPSQMKRLREIEE